MNVIVIIADSLRVDHLGCYGNPWIRTPNLDRLAGEATLFEHAYSEGLPTLPTRTAFWTGRFTFPFRGWQRLEPDDVVLAEILWDKGCTSALITDVYHMHAPGMNFGRGFDTARFIRGQEYDPWIVDESISVDLTPHYKPSGVPAQDERFRKGLEQYLRNRHGWKSDEDHFVAQVCKAGIKWLEEHRGGKDLFLWLDCFDPHEPWDPCPPYDTMYDPGYEGLEIIDPVPGESSYLTEAELKHIRALYAGEVSIVDKWVGAFLDAAREMGFFDDSLIIFTSDHGEPLGEHGIIRKCRPWLHEELVHIPWLVRMPDGTGHGQRISAFVETCDMAPTVLDFLGADVPEQMHGQSLLPLIRGQIDGLREYAYSGFFGKQWSIRSHEWSLLVPLDGSPKELYHRRTDPKEERNVARERGEVLDRMELELRRFVEELRRRG